MRDLKIGTSTVNDVKCNQGVVNKVNMVRGGHTTTIWERSLAVRIRSGTNVDIGHLINLALASRHKNIGNYVGVIDLVFDNNARFIASSTAHAALDMGSGYGTHIHLVPKGHTNWVATGHTGATGGHGGTGRDGNGGNGGGGGTWLPAGPSKRLTLSHYSGGTAGTAGAVGGRGHTGGTGGDAIRLRGKSSHWLASSMTHKAVGGHGGAGGAGGAGGRHGGHGGAGTKGTGSDRFNLPQATVGGHPIILGAPGCGGGGGAGYVPGKGGGYGRGFVASNLITAADGHAGTKTRGGAGGSKAVYLLTNNRPVRGPGTDNKHSVIFPSGHPGGGLGARNHTGPKGATGHAGVSVRA